MANSIHQLTIVEQAVGGEWASMGSLTQEWAYTGTSLVPRRHGNFTEGLKAAI